MLAYVLTRNTLMAAAALALAFLLSLAVSWIYTRLHRNTAYSRNFVQALALAGVVSALIVLSIGDSIARGIGLVGALTVVRFRSNLKDPRDLIFAFAALAVGVASGAQAFGVALLGTALFFGGTLVVTRSWFAPERGKVDTFDAILSLRLSGNGDGLDSLTRALRAQCDGHALARVRQTGDGAQELAYQLKMKQPDAKVALFQTVERIPGVAGAQLVAYDDTDDL